MKILITGLLSLQVVSALKGRIWNRMDRRQDRRENRRESIKSYLGDSSSTKNTEQFSKIEQHRNLFKPFLEPKNFKNLVSDSQKMDENAYVELPQGKLQGNANINHFAFHGIPYAKPPVDNLRWKPAQNPENWSGTLSITDPTTIPGCKQDPTHATAPLTQSEDCLFLNIYTPTQKIIERTPNKNKRPVMVWFHGGSWVHGHGAADLYNGRHLAATQGVIVVTVNYRLGAFGFLYDEHEPGVISGNQAITDWIKALEWVQKNIEYFYGDPDNVTIFGESAGAQSVATLLSLINNVDARNYYQKAIVQSSPFGMHYRKPNEATEEAETLYDKLDCKDGRNDENFDKMIDCAMSRSADEIVEAAAKVRGIIDRDLLVSVFEAWTPVIDNILIDRHPLNAFYDGVSDDKVLMTGHTTGEGSVFIYSIFANEMGKTAYQSAIGLLFGDDKQAILRQYPSNCRTIDRHCDMRPQLSRIAGSYLFDCPMRKAISNRAKNSGITPNKTFYYLFDHPLAIDGIPDNAISVCEKTSCHGAELPFMFETFEDLDIQLRDVEISLALKMGNYWSNFAWNSNPNRSDDIQERPQGMNCWQEWSNLSTDTCGEGENYDPFTMVHLKTGEFENDVDPDGVMSDCDFWDSLDSYLEH